MKPAVPDNKMGKKAEALDVILSRRSIRQFQPKPVAESILKSIVNAARLAPSAGNLQPLEFIAIRHKAQRSRVFPCLRWAAYIAPEGNPKPGHEPQAYVVVLVNSRIRNSEYERDVGAAVENMILAAWAQGVGSCWLVSIEKKKLRTLIRVPDYYWIDSVLALGYPDENPVVETMNSSVQYWKDEKGCFHVPKRPLEDILHYETFGEVKRKT